MKKAVIAALASLLLLSLAACGSSKHTLSAEEKKAATNMAKSFAAQSSGKVTIQEATCFADDFVGTAGLAKLKSANVLDASDQLNQANPKFDKTLATQFAHSFLGCIDYEKKQAEVIAAADPKVDATKLEACLKVELPESYVTKLIVAAYTQDPQSATLNNDSSKKLEDCRTKSSAK